MKGADIVVNLLKIAGVSKVFGYPGGFILDVYHSLYNNRDSIEHILPQGEQGAVYAADGYARISGKLGVVISTSGPGASNLTTGIAAANMDSSSVLAITGNVPLTSLGSDSFQEVDITGITMPVTKYNQIVKSVQELPEIAVNAIRIATDGRKGAVLLDLPQDVQQAEWDITYEELEKLYLNSLKRNIYGISREEINKAADIINRANKITLLLGGGAKHANAEAEIVAFAEKLKLPVVTTLMAVGSYPNSSPHYFGLTGAYGNPTANYALKVSDLIIALGVRFNDRLLKSGVFNGKRIIQIDIDESEHDKNIDAFCFVKGDIREALPLLTEKVRERNSKLITTLATYSLKVGKGDNMRKIRNALSAIASVTDEHSIIATDVGEHQMAVAKNYVFGKNFLTSGGLGAMGWGLGAIIGGLSTKYAEEHHSKGFLITGDGSFNMEFNELLTAVKLKLPLAILIFNNGYLGMARTAQVERFNYCYMTDCATGVDYVKLAESMGAKGYRTNSVNGLKKILKNNDYSTPIVVDLKIFND